MRAPEEAASRFLFSPEGAGPLLSADGIEVDFSALGDFAITLRSLASELGNRNGSLTGGLADPDLAGALSRAERDWSDQRRRLGAFLDGAAQSVQAALAGYRALEAELERAASPALR